jgi:hypothetical protein
MFQELVNAQLTLNKRMHECLVDLLRKNNGLIITEDCNNDPIYAFIMDEELGRVTEYRILAVALFDDSVCILPAVCDNETLDGMAYDEIMESDNWYSVYGGMCQISSTLYDICEVIDEYIREDNDTDK